jgi:lysozyme family protein
MSNFDEAIGFVLSNEGGLSNDPSDPGGLTNFGISQKQYPALDIRNLTREDAVQIYQDDYWNKFQYGDITSQRVATKLFDSAVNMGPVRAVRLLQLAVNVQADGVLGVQTIAAVNAADESNLMDEFKAQLAKYYCDLGKPEFMLGWLRRAVRG